MTTDDRAERASATDVSQEQWTGATGGFSLVEVVIAVVLVGAIFGSAFSVVVSGSQTVELELAESRLRTKIQRVLERAAADLRSARIEPIVDATSLGFRKLQGRYEDGFADFDFDTAEVLWDGVPVSRYFWEVVPDELLNGADDNGDGRVDEGVLKRVADGTTATVARNVPRGGFTVRLVGTRKLEFELALEQVRGAGEIVRSSETGIVFLRN